MTIDSFSFGAGNGAQGLTQLYHWATPDLTKDYTLCVSLASHRPLAPTDFRAESPVLALWSLEGAIPRESWAAALAKFRGETEVENKSEK